MSYETYDTTTPTNVPIKGWLPLDELDDASIGQLVNAANHPEAGPHVAVMPDAHVGYGVTIGCVFPTVNAVIPNAVGVDIGCGMSAIRTDHKFDSEHMDQRFWDEWAGRVLADVPVGFRSHKEEQWLDHLDRPLRAEALQPFIKKKAAYQLGTLGGGNHFLEAQVDEEGYIWFMVHSGSRHTGLQIAGYYHKQAETITAKRGLAVGKDLASLPLDDQLGQDYLHDMTWATDFAYASRQQMISEMFETFLLMAPFVNDDYVEYINIHHNYAEPLLYDGTPLIVHRKGATSAGAGELGIIPGSMGSPSYIVRGKGNPESFRSCSHGAGRTMGRGVAKRTITEEQFQRSIAGTFSRASMRYVDEAPDAYKSIETVIARQADLIDIVHTLNPIITLKGDSRAKDD